MLPFKDDSLFMTPVIKKLPEHLINQIAAGEVIESPASVVKELIDNAIDAGAKRIELEVTGGGHQSIILSDDGCGMSREDALLSLERHTTSKLFKFEDLETLSTLGFRGEALASIAAVSRLTLKTARANEIGTLLELEAGNILKQEACARNPGTTIEIRSLFFNTPARRKFQKSASASFLEIWNMVIKLLLAHPHLEFSLIKDGKKYITIPAPDASKDFFFSLKKRIPLLLESRFTEELIPLEFYEEDLHIRGFLGSLNETKLHRKDQYIFINKRPIVSPLISYSVKDALATRIEVDRHPIFVLHIDIPQDSVDINVHPQKKEVRFKEEQKIRKLLQKALFACLEGTATFASFNSLLNWDHLSSSKEEGVSYEMKPSVMPSLSKPATLNLDLYYQCEFLGVYESFLLLRSSALSQALQVEEKGLFILHLPRAEERIRLMSIQSKGWRVDSQALLFPEPISFPLDEMIKVENHLVLLKKLGFEMQALGKTTFLVEACPSFIEVSDLKNLFEMLLPLMDLNDTEKLFQALCHFPSQKKRSFMLEQAKEVFRLLISLPLQPLMRQGIIALWKEKDIHELFSKRSTSF